MNAVPNGQPEVESLLVIACLIGVYWDTVRTELCFNPNQSICDYLDCDPARAR